MSESRLASVGVLALVPPTTRVRFRWTWASAAACGPTSRSPPRPDGSRSARHVDANGVPGYVVVQGQRTRVVGGTSASTRRWRACSRSSAQQLGGGGLGQLLPSIYRLGNEAARGLRPAVFRDVTVGSNGFSAGPGFDLASGFGSPIPEPLAAGLANVARRCASPSSAVSSRRRDPSDARARPSG